MGNPLLGEETGPPVRHTFLRKKREPFGPVAADADAMLLPSERRPAGGKTASGGGFAVRSIGRQAMAAEDVRTTSPVVRAVIPTRRANSPAVPRARVLDPELHPREVSSRSNYSVAAAGGCSGDASGTGATAERPFSQNRQKTDVTGWSYDTHWTVPTGMLPNGEASLNPRQPRSTLGSKDRPASEQKAGSERIPATARPRSTYVADEPWMPRGLDIRHGKSPGNPLGGVGSDATADVTVRSHGTATSILASHA